MSLQLSYVAYVPIAISLYLSTQLTHALMLVHTPLFMCSMHSVNESLLFSFLSVQYLHIHMYALTHVA